MFYSTYASLLNKKLVVPSQKTAYFAVDRSFFVQVFSTVIANIFVDEGWYLNFFPDVQEGITRKDFRDASDHFVKAGFYEHRMPYEIDVDEAWYLDNYRDIADAVRSGTFASGRDHFYIIGYREGRFPHAEFTLRARTPAPELAEQLN
jgi:hypothetical protein